MKNIAKISSVSLVLLIVLLQNIKAQDSHNHHLSATVFNENIGIPLDMKSGAPLHFGATISYEWSRKRSGVYSSNNILQAGYYHHDNFHEVLYLAWKPTFQVLLFEVLELHATAGVGYAHSFPTQQSYRLEDGRYEKRRNAGKPHFMPSIGAGIGFNLDKIIETPVALFARYEAFGLGPYAAEGFAPFTVNTMTHIGLKFCINKNK